LASKRKSKLREYIEAVVIAVFLALLIRAFVVQAYKIPSGSMIPTLLIGDHILVNKFTYGIKVPFTDNRVLIFNQPKRGDVIVFSFPKNKEQAECTSVTKNISTRIGNAWSSGNPFYLFRDDCKDFIKRLIGVGGDKIEVRNKIVYVNGVPLDEPYAIHNDINVEGPPRDNFGPFTVPRGSFFVMGDNRDQSYDSRFWGVVDMDEIKGRAFIMYWSWDSEGSLLNQVRWSRLGKLIH
jgi:signal peptidase I